MSRDLILTSLLTLALVTGCTSDLVGSYADLIDHRTSLHLEGDWSPEETEAIAERCHELNSVLRDDYACSVATEGRIAVTKTDTPPNADGDQLRYEVSPGGGALIVDTVGHGPRETAGMVTHLVARLVGVKGDSTCGLTDDHPPSLACWSGISPEDVALCKESGACK